MKKLFILFLLPSLTFAFDTFESERYLYAYLKFNKEIKRISSEIPLDQNDPQIIQDLKFELKSCGITSSNNSCLDSKFKAVNALESFSDDNQEGLRFLVKGYTQGFSDKSIVIQVMTIHSELEQIILDRVEFFNESILLTNEGFKEFFQKYLGNELKKIFETNKFYSHEISNYLEIAKKSENSFEIFHSIAIAKSLDGEKIHEEEINNILKDKFDAILNTNSPLYQVEFLNLFTDLNDLKRNLAERFFRSNDSNVKGKSAIVLANLSVNEPQIKQTVISIVKTGINYHDQLGALEGLYKIRNNIDDDILILQSIKNGNQEVSKKAYELSNTLTFTKDHLSYLTGELKNPIPDYRIIILDFLSKINSPETTKIILESLNDITEPVTKKAFLILKERTLDPQDFLRIKKIIKTLKDFTKFYGLQLLDRDKSEEISDLFLDHLTDISPKVEELAVHLIQGREITPGLKKKLWKLVKKKKTKIYSLNILSKLETPDITSLFINELTEVELEDLNGLYELIKKRNLDSTFLEKIKLIYKNKEPRIRIIGIKLLAKYPEMQTLDFLNKILPLESEKSVKNTIETLIKFLSDLLIPKPVPNPEPQPPTPVDPNPVTQPTTTVDPPTTPELPIPTPIPNPS